MSFRPQWELNTAICKAIGIDPKTVTRIVIDLSGDHPARVRVSAFLDVEQDKSLIKLFEATKFEELGTTKFKELGTS